MPNEQLNQELQSLMKEVLDLTDNPARQIALTKLLRAIQNSGALAHPQSTQWPPNLYLDYYQEALQMTLMEVCQKCDRYDFKHPVMAWVNTILKRRLIDVIRKYRGRRSSSKAAIVQKRQTISLDDLTIEVAASKESEDLGNVRDFLRNDPEQILQSIRLTSHPHITLQTILVLKCIDDCSWQDISSQLNVEISTLSSFYQRNLKKQKDYFARHLR